MTAAAAAAAAEDSTVNATEWLDAYARELGIEPPTPDDFKTLLDLAAEAAHSSERVAAPVACWLAARAGRPPGEALELARAVTPTEGAGA